MRELKTYDTIMGIGIGKIDTPQNKNSPVDYEPKPHDKRMLSEKCPLRAHFSVDAER
jgi:hypothetical protein